MTQNKELNTFITKFYLYNFFSLMGFIIPFVAVMLDVNGLSATQIALCMMASRVVQVIMEVPSGAIADKFSRKYVLLVSRLLNGMPYVFWILMPNFWGYLIGYMFFGLNMSLDSGCVEAFVYDELAKYKRRDLFERVQGRKEACVSIGLLTVSVVAAFLVKLGFGYNFLMFLSICTTVISAFIMFLIKPAKSQKKIEEDVLKYFEILKKGIKYSFSHKTVLKLFFFLAFTSSINIGILEYAEIFYNEITGSLSKVAILFGLVELAAGIGSFGGEYLRKFKIKTLLFIYFTNASLYILMYAVYSFLFSFILAIINAVVMCMIVVNFIARTNDFIPSNIRATVLSVRGLIEAIGTIICLFFFGLVVDKFGSYQIGFLTFAVIYAVGSLGFCVVLWKDKSLK